MEIKDWEKQDVVDLAKLIKIEVADEDKVNTEKLIQEIDLKIGNLNKALILKGREDKASDVNAKSTFKGLHPITGEKIK